MPSLFSSTSKSSGTRRGVYSCTPMNPVEKYYVKFGKSLPLFMLRHLNDYQIDELIQKCLDEGKPYEPGDADPDVFY